jgi:hypothetical protein
MKLIQDNNQLNINEANVCGVYGFQLPDGGWLVGYSTNILNRFCQYYRVEKKSGNLKFRDAVGKCGWSAVKGYVLEECPNDKKTLLSKEGEWSRKLDSVKNGYNVMECGVESGTNVAIYKDINYRMSVSDGMRRYHEKRKLSGKTGYSMSGKVRRNVENVSEVTEAAQY